MSLKVKIIGVIILCYISIVSFGQTASAVFESDNSFQLTINNIKQYKSYTKSSEVYKISGERAYNIKVEFESRQYAPNSK